MFLTVTHIVVVLHPSQRFAVGKKTCQFFWQIQRVDTFCPTSDLQRIHTCYPKHHPNGMVVSTQLKHQNVPQKEMNIKQSLNNHPINIFCLRLEADPVQQRGIHYNPTPALGEVELLRKAATSVPQRKPYLRSVLPPPLWPVETMNWWRSGLGQSYQLQ